MAAKDEEYSEEIEKLLEELRLTKEYIATLQKDLDNKVKLITHSDI